MRVDTTQIMQSNAAVRPGDHVAHLYTSAEERNRLCFAFFVQALNAEQPVVYFGNQENEQAFHEYVRQHHPDHAGQLSDRTFRCIYRHQTTGSKKADPCHEALKEIKDAVRKAQADKFDNARIFAEPFAYFGDTAAPELILLFGAQMDTFLHREKIPGLCVFNENANPTLLLSVLSTHPLLSRGRDVFDNYHYLPPHVIMAQHSHRAAYRYRIKSLVERKRSNAKIRLLGAVLHDSHDAVIIHSVSGQILVWNHGAEELYGLTESEALHRNKYDLVPEYEKKRLKNLVDSYGIDNTAQAFESQRTHEDGESLEVWVSASVMTDEKGQPTAVISTERKLAEHLRASPEVLIQSEQRFRSLLHNVEEYIYSLIYHPDGSVASAYHSPKCKEITGYSPEDYVDSPKLWFEMIHEQDRQQVSEFLDHLLASGGTGSIDHRLIRADGSTCWVSNTCTVATSKDGGLERLDGFIMDITERKKAEKKRLQAEQDIQEKEKLDSLAVLAGGIAHDFNNLLTVVMGNVDLTLQEVPEDSPAAEYLKEVRQAATKASRLAGEMLAYTGYGKPTNETCDLSQSIRGLENIFRTIVPTAVELKFELTEAPLPVEIDSEQVRKVCKNLLRNASEAVGGSGKITVRTGLMDADKEYLDKAFYSEHTRAGRYAWLEVEDNGSGIAEDIKNKIFDPFFSTNFTGRGLGLSVVQGVVRSQDGAIKVDSKQGVGTKFRILLPTEQTNAAEPVQERRPATAKSTGGTVLVVDDEKSLVNLAKLVLRKNGMTVYTAFNGAEGVEQFEQHATDIDVVLLDLTMPVMNGVEAFRHIRELRKDVAVIFSSGYTDTAMELQQIPKQENVTFLQKPYTTQKLRSAVGKAVRQHQVYQ